jgi:tetratricopeptide (TPR) repeat protein
MRCRRVRDDPAAATELARYCDYLPLALRIVAERLVANPYLRVADVVEELAETHERLDALVTDGDQFATVRVVFSWSYRALPPDAARMFRLLGLPKGPDISAAAATVLAGVTKAKARRLLDQLVGAHLLQEHSPQRYRFHDLLRVYAAECAETDESAADRRAATYRLLTWYTQSANAAAHAIAPHLSRIPVNLPTSAHTPLTFPDRLTALHWCDSEHANLIAAVSQAVDIGDHAIAWQLPVIVLGFFLVRRPFTEWVTTHRIGLTSAHLLGERPAEVWLQTSIAIAHRELREYDLALENLHPALAGWREIGQHWGEAWALRDLGNIYHLLGRAPEAIDMLQQALALHIAEGDTWGEAVALSTLAIARHSLGHFDEALTDLNRALSIYREHSDQRNVASALSNLGLVHHGLGQTQEAIEYLEQALTMHRAVDNWHGEAVAHERLGTLLNDVGQTEIAKEHLRTAAKLYETIGDPRADDLG